MLKIDQLRELIIKPALLDLVLFTEDAMELLVFTCAVESLGGTYLKQVNGPALGIYQMEPETYNDIWNNYVRRNQPLCMMLGTNFHVTSIPDEQRLVYDLRYATAMARIHYLRVPEVIPTSKDIEGIYRYYKNYYNTPQGAATHDEALQKYYALLKS